MLNYYEIGQRIRKYRKAHGLSQEELAERTDISVTHMSHIETGNTKLSLGVLVSISTALGVGTDDILFDRPQNSIGCDCEEAAMLLEGMSPGQRRVILEMLRAAKVSMKKHL